MSKKSNQPEVITIPDIVLHKDLGCYYFKWNKTFKVLYVYRQEKDILDQLYLKQVCELSSHDRQYTYILNENYRIIVKLVFGEDV